MWQNEIKIHSHQPSRWIKSLWRKIKLYLHKTLEIVAKFQSVDFQWMQVDMLNFIKSITSLNDKIIVNTSVWCYYWKILYFIADQKQIPNCGVLGSSITAFTALLSHSQAEVGNYVLNLWVPWVIDVASFFNEVKLFFQLYHSICNIIRHDFLPCN